MTRILQRTLLMLLVLLGPLSTATAQSFKQKYTKEKPLIIVGDWDKPPYEFQDEKGQPAGTNVESMGLVFERLDIPYKYVLKEWSIAIKMFERGEADVILANRNRYRNEKYAISENVINYNRICAASLGDSVRAISHDELLREGVVLKPGDYSTLFFRDVDSIYADKVETQSPKVALMGIKDGIYRYFVWGEEPLKWKIRELNLEGVVLNDVQIPVSDIYIIGHDRALIEAMDDQYSRLKQSGDIQLIIDKWCHPERIKEKQSLLPYFIIAAVLALIAIFYLFSQLARKHVESVTRSSTELNNMMYKALHMGNFDVTEYDIKRDLMTNRYGKILPEKGIKLEEFIAHIHPSEQQEFRKKMDRLLNGRDKKFELNKRWKSFDKEGVWLNFHGHAIVELDDEGRPAYIINAVHDVTQNMEQDRQKRELACKYERLSNMPFVAMSFYDGGGWLITLNDAMRTICGINEDAPDSKRFWETVCMFDIPLFRNAYSPDDREPLLVCQHMYYPEIGLDNYIEFHVQPLFNDKGELANYFISTLDITDERNRDHDLHKYDRETRLINKSTELYRARLRFMLEKDKNYIWDSTIETRRWDFYRSLDEPIDVPLTFDTSLAYMAEDERIEVLPVLTNQLPDQKPFSLLFHYAHTLLSNDPAWFIISGRPVFDENGYVVGQRGLSREVTSLMLTRRALEAEKKLASESARLKSGFMASMTHELRTPLNAIIGFTSVLETVNSPEERDEYIRIIRNSSDMLQRLINDILEASSETDDGPTSIELMDIDFAKAFDDICLTLLQRVQDPKVEFIRENPYFTFPTRIDIGRVQQVITNFVTNAVKFTKEGHIRVGYRYEKEGIHVYCEDTGIGIPKNKQQIIFDRFIKLDEFVQGTGMGLAICKSIIERYGGQIGVFSQGPGKGSTFWFWIPCERLA